MHESTDRKFDWVAALALGSGVVVMLPSLIALAIALGAVVLAMV